MIIACPACSTRYEVLDSAIGVDGRVVRCAKCRHDWFQDGQGIAAAEVDDGVDPPAAAEPGATTTEPGFAVPQALPPDDHDDAEQAREFAESPSSFAHEPPFRPRRSRASIWLMIIIALAVVAIAAGIAIVELGLPNWLPLPLPRNASAQAMPDLVLNFPPDRQELRPLPSGGDFFNVSGTVVNVGRERRTVPMLMIVLRNDQHDIVYSLETASPKPVLAPGESETINQAIIDAPGSARAAEISWKPN